jgi:hypothetical protein
MLGGTPVFPLANALIPVRQVSVNGAAKCLKRTAGLTLEALKTCKLTIAMTVTISPSRAFIKPSMIDIKIPATPWLVVDRLLATQ